VLSLTERIVLQAALILATAAAWSVTIIETSEVPTFYPFLFKAFCGTKWTVGSATSAFIMWVSMMVAMMLPSTAAVIDAFATIARRRRARQQPYTPTLVFVGGYIVAWSCFGAVATIVQWQLYSVAILAPNMQNTSLAFAGVILLTAGLYQFTALKLACLRGCRSPLAFIISEWRDGHFGAFFMGVRHGFFCVGCCWALMALMFCVSIMDLRWAAALAIYTTIEKLMVGGDSIFAPAFGSFAMLIGAILIVISLFGT
jgi:predicted metal-binding membrane protein